MLGALLGPFLSVLEHGVGFAVFVRLFATSSTGGFSGAKGKAGQGGLVSWVMCNSGLSLIANAYRPDNADIAFLWASRVVWV